MNKSSIELKKYIADILINNIELKQEELEQLSLLGESELEYMRNCWHNAKINRQREIIENLLILSKKKLFLDFSDIFKFCLSEKDGFVRSKALAGLSEEEDENLIKTFIHFLQNDTFEIVRVEAALALGKLAMQGELGNISEGHKTLIYNSLLKVLDNDKETYKVKAAALEAIAPLNLPRVKQLIESAYYSNQKELKLGAITAMGLNCNRYWLKFLGKEIQSDDELTRLTTVRALAELGEEEGALYLLELLEDESFQVQLEAIRALGKVGGVEAQHILNNLLNDTNTIISNTAAEALKELELCEDQQFLNF